MAVKKRTITQNRSMWKWFELLSKELNDSSLGVMTTLKHDIEIPWTKNLIKDLIFDFIMRSSFKIDSSTKLTTKQMSNICEIMDKFMLEKHGINIPFPSTEDQMLEDLVKTEIFNETI